MRPQQQPGLRDRLRFHNWPIATKLLAASLGLAIIPLLIAIAITGSVSSDALTRQTRISLSRLSYSVAQRITQALTDKQGLLQVAAGDPTVAELLTAPSPEARATLQGDGQQAIQNLLSASSAIDVVGLYNATGMAMAHSDPGLVGRDFSTRDFVKAGLAGEAYTSPYRVDAASDTPGLNLSAPVLKGDQVVGAIAVRVKGSFIIGMLEDALSAAGQDIAESERTAVQAYLVNPQGIVVGQSTDAGWLYHTLVNADTPELRDQIATLRPLGLACPDGATQCEANQKVPRAPEPIPAAHPLGETLLQGLRADEGGSYRYCRPTNPAAAASDCSGNWHIVGFSPVRVLSGSQTAAGANLLMAVVDIPEDVFLQSVSRQRALGLGITAVIALLALLASLLLAAALAKPISRLATISQEIEADKPFQPEQLADLASHKDEVGHLARVYTNMVVALRARMAELRTIHEIGRTMNTSVQLPETLDYVATAIRQVINYDAVEICLYEQNLTQMVVHLAVGGEPVGEPPQAHAVDQGLLARMMQAQAGVLVSDIQAAPEADAGIQRTWRQIAPRAFLGVPLVAKGQVIGSIELVHREPGAFNQDNLRILESIAVQAAVAVRNAQEVLERESKLKQEIQELHIEINEAKREKEVQSIVGTEYFQRLREKARRLRGAGREPSEPGRS